MPRALLFFNAHRGQCQKRRRLKVITRRSSAKVRSSGVSVGGDSRKWRGKRGKNFLGNVNPGGSCRGQVRPSRKSSSIVFRVRCQLNTRPGGQGCRASCRRMNWSVQVRAGKQNYFQPWRSAGDGGDPLASRDWVKRCVRGDAGSGVVQAGGGNDSLAALRGTTQLQGQACSFSNLCGDVRMVGSRRIGEAPAIPGRTQGL